MNIRHLSTVLKSFGNAQFIEGRALLDTVWGCRCYLGLSAGGEQDHAIKCKVALVAIDRHNSIVNAA